MEFEVISLTEVTVKPRSTSSSRWANLPTRLKALPAGQAVKIPDTEGAESRTLYGLRVSLKNFLKKSELDGDYEVRNTSKGLVVCYKEGHGPAVPTTETETADPVPAASEAAATTETAPQVQEMQRTGGRPRNGRGI